MSDPHDELPWRPTACVLCSINCGLEARVADGGLVKIRGDRRHPGSQGYTTVALHPYPVWRHRAKLDELVVGLEAAATGRDLRSRWRGRR